MPREVLIRLSGFVPVFGLMASWELLAPRRHLATSKATRWLANLSLVGLNTLVVRWLFAAGAVGAASMAVTSARKGSADHVVGVNLTPLKDLLAAVQAANIPIWVCGACAVARQIGQADLIAGAVIKGMPDYIKAVAERDRTVAF